MLDSRTQDEACVFNGFKFERTVRLFEHRQLALLDDLRRSEPSSMHGDPCNGVTGGRLVAPSLTFLQCNVQVIDSRWRETLLVAAP